MVDAKVSLVSVCVSDDLAMSLERYGNDCDTWLLVPFVCGFAYDWRFDAICGRKYGGTSFVTHR